MLAEMDWNRLIDLWVPAAKWKPQRSPRAQGDPDETEVAHRFQQLGPDAIIRIDFFLVVQSIDVSLRSSFMTL